MIQQSINQMLGSIAVAGRLSPEYEKMQEGKAITGKANISEAGLKEIAGNLENPEKNYTKTELEDIEDRVREHNRNVYTAKTAALTNKYVDTSSLRDQPTYSASLQSIEQNLEKRRMALERVQEKGTAALEQDKNFKETMDLIKNYSSGFSYPHMFTGGLKDAVTDFIDKDKKGWDEFLKLFEESGKVEVNNGKE